jgi:CheY-like chemotaxis protein
MSAQPPVVHVVDDDESFRVALVRLLRATGYCVKSHASVADFLAELGDAAGCVISDLRMPGMDGLDLQQALKRGVNGLPVIFLSGLAADRKQRGRGCRGPRVALVGATQQRQRFSTPAGRMHSDGLHVGVTRVVGRQPGGLDELLQGCRLVALPTHQQQTERMVQVGVARHDRQPPAQTFSASASRPCWRQASARLT